MKFQKNTLVALNFFANINGDQTKNFLEYGGGLASSRIQLKPAIEAADKAGLNSQVWSLHSTNPKDLYRIPKAKVCLIGKISANTNKLIHNMTVANLAAVAQLKMTGSKIILLYSDNHIADKSSLKELYKDFAFYADAVVCPTQLLEKRFRSATNFQKEIFIIEDPWSLAEYTYVKNATPFLRIAWFGSGLNIPYLARELPRILDKKLVPFNLELSILSSKFGIQKLAKFVEKIKFDKTVFKINFIEWDDSNQPFQLENLLIKSEIALIPSDPKDPRKAGVSHNRLVDASRCGCIPIASPMESYKELHKLALIGDNFPLLIRYAHDHKIRLQHKYESLRGSVLSRFSPTENNKKWLRLIQHFH